MVGVVSAYCIVELSDKEVEKQVEVQRSLAAEVADKSVLVEKIRMTMQQELKNNQEVLEEEVMAKLVMMKVKEAVEKELKRRPEKRRQLKGRCSSRIRCSLKTIAGSKQWTPL